MLGADTGIFPTVSLAVGHRTPIKRGLAAQKACGAEAGLGSRSGQHSGRFFPSRNSTPEPCSVPPPPPPQEAVTTAQGEMRQDTEDSTSEGRLPVGRVGCAQADGSWASRELYNHRVWLALEAFQAFAFLYPSSGIAFHVGQETARPVLQRPQDKGRCPCFSTMPCISPRQTLPPPSPGPQRSGDRALWHFCTRPFPLASCCGEHDSALSSCLGRTATRWKARAWAGLRLLYSGRDGLWVCLCSCAWEAQ